MLDLAIVTSTYPRDEADHSVPWMRESLRRLAARGHRITVLAPAWEGSGDHEVDGIPVRRFRYAPRALERLTHEEGAPNKVHRRGMHALAACYVASGMLAAARLARGRRFDLVHSHWPFPHAAIARRAAAVCGARAVTTCHGAELALARQKRWVAGLLRAELRRADLVIANSRHTAEAVRGLAGVEAQVLPFGSSVERATHLLEPTAEPYVLFTGRLVERKGVDVLLRAMALVLERRRARLVVCGGGELRPGLIELARELGIAGSVDFAGFVPSARLAELYAGCDCFAMPAVHDSRGDTEGLGVSAIEALLHGRPVIVSEVGGLVDVVEHGVTGWLVPERDPRRLADAILHVLEHPREAERVARAGARFARATFDWERITDRLEALYAGVLGRPVAAPAPAERHVA